MKRHPRKLLLPLALLALAAGPCLYAYTFLSIQWSSAAAASGINMHLQLGGGGTLSDGAASWGKVAEGALAEWNSYVKNFKFTVTRDSTIPIVANDGKNSVFFSKTVFGDAFDDNVLAVTTKWSNGNVRTEADVVFNSNYQWNSYRGNQWSNGVKDLRRVALHEFGHALGLNHPDQAGQTVTALMNSLIGNLDDLAQDDISGGQALWGTPTPTVNLALYQPTGWSGKLVISKGTGTNLDSTGFTNSDTLYLDFAPVNNGTSAINASWNSKIYVDGTEVSVTSRTSSLAGNTYYTVVDRQIGPLSAGSHTLRVVVDADYDVAESSESDNTFERTISVSGPLQPNLTFAQPPNWTSKAVVSTQTGTNSDSSPIYVTDTIYLDFAPFNNGTATVPGNWDAKCYIDNVLRRTVTANDSLAPNFYFSNLLDVDMGKLAAGTHKLRIDLDVNGSVSEGNEGDNSYERDITVISQALPNLHINSTPSGWPDTMVVSNVTGTNTDGATLLSTDTLYLDFQPGNDGTATAGAPWNIKVYVDGVLKKTQSNNIALNAGNYFGVDDLSLDPLPAGQHQIKVVVDADNAVTESNEGDNEYQRTITVSSLPGIWGGPLTNPATGNAYTILYPSTWALAAAKATALGGYLVTVDDAAEQTWLMSKFGGEPLFWIGLSDAASEGNYSWHSGQSSSYRNWRSGEPNGGSSENYVAVYGNVFGAGWAGYWNDINNAGQAGGYTAQGIVEFTPPFFLGYSNNKTISQGQTTSLSASAGGSLISYQWYRGSSGVTSNPVGSNSPSYTTPALNATTSYWVRVTGAGGLTADSGTITVTVLSTNANLSGLTLSSGSLSPAFAPATLAYGASVSNATSSVTVTPTVEQANATVRVKGNVVASGAASAAIPLSIGSNSIDVVVTSQDGSATNTYTVTVTRAASPDATLAALVFGFGSLTPSFTSGNLSYTANVANGVTSTIATPTATQPGATIKVNNVAVGSGSSSGSLTLLVGNNPITTVVTAPDGVSTLTYTVTVYRAPSTNADLAGLTINPGYLTTVFSSGVTTYNASVSYLQSPVNVTPTTAHNAATVKVGETTVASGSSVGVPLTVGNNDLAVVVTAEDGITKKTYTISVTRAPPAPRIVLQRPAGYVIGAGVTDNFSGVYIGSSASHSDYEIWNSGTADLTGIGMSIIGSNKDEFSASALPSTTLAPNGRMGFTLTFTPAGQQSRNATLRIVSNDSIQPTYDVKLTGTGDEGVSFSKGFSLLNEDDPPMEIEVVRTSAVGSASVRVQVSYIGASSGDFQFTDGQTIQFSEGELAKSVTLTPLLDTIPESNEDVEFYLTDSQGAIVQGYTSQRVRIVDTNDTTKPTLTLTAPATNAVVTSSQVFVTGKATDNKGIAKVLVSQNGHDYEELPVNLWSGGQSLDFSNPLTLAAGVNTISVKSVDTRDHESAVVTRTVTYHLFDPLTVNVQGLGTVPRPFPGTDYTKKVGFNYTLTATPAAGQVFDGWTCNDSEGTGVTPESAQLPKLTFTHQTGLVLTAHFIPNPFTPGLVGKFNGLVTTYGPPPAPPALTNIDGTGFFTATVTGTGSFTGTMKIGGLSMPVAGAFDNLGVARFGTMRYTFCALQRPNRYALHLQLNLDMTGASGKMSGSITEGPLYFPLSTLEADRAHYSATHKVSENLAGKSSKPYTLVLNHLEALNGGLGESAFPQGEGYASGTLRTDGTVTFTGKLADHTGFTAAAPLSKANMWPLFASLYTGSKGCVAGRVIFDDAPADTDLAGTDVLWIRPPVAGQWYPQGWPQGILLDAIGCKYAAPPASVFPGLPAVDSINGNAALTWTGGGLVLPVTKLLNITPANVVSKAPKTDASFTFTLTATTGLFSGTFNASANAKPGYQGVLLQKGANRGGFGYFLSTQPKVSDGLGQSGAVSLLSK